MFCHIDNIDIPKLNLETKTINGSRFYNIDGTLYPSVTSVLSMLSRDSIKKWRDRIGHNKADSISRKSAIRGTHVHTICEKYLNNDKYYLKDCLPDRVEMFKSIQPILDKHINNIHGQELAMYSNWLNVAGRVDCIAEWDGELSIIDFKTSNKLKKKEWIDNYFMQCAAYARMYYEHTGIAIKKTVIVVAVNQDSPQIFEEKVLNWILPFRDLVALYRKENELGLISE